MLDVVKQSGAAPAIPFDADRLDRLMDEAGIDVLIASSKHNVQYLLGGHRAFFFDYMDAMGLSRYLPVLVYPKGAPDKAAFFGHRMESFQKENQPFWVPEQQTNSSGSVDTMQKAIDYMPQIRREGAARSAPSSRFLPVDAGTALRNALPRQRDHGCAVRARAACARSRARRNCEKLRIASERVINSMLAVIANHGPGATKRELTEALRREETNRGLHLRILPDHGGHEPQPRAVRAEMGARARCSRSIPAAIITAISATSAAWRSTASRMPSSRTCWPRSRRSSAPPMKPIKAGAMGSEIYAAAEPLVRKSKHHNHMHFLAHGMGLVSHEAPRLTASGPVPYDDYDAEPAARDRDGRLGRDHAAASAARLHQARGHRRGHRHRLRHLRRGRPRLEPRRLRSCAS